MLGLIVGIIGCFGSLEAGDSTDVVSGDTVIIKAIDTTMARVVTVNRVLILGNKVTKARIIQRELSLKPGDTITTTRLPQALVKDRNKIYNLRLFNTVSIKVLDLPDNTIDLLVEVEERWYLFPAPIFELSDRNFNEWWQNYNHDFSRVNYGLRLSQYNFRGRNETVRLTAQFGYTRRFELSYQIPYIDKKQKRGLLFSFDYGEPKNLAYYTNDHKLVYLEDTKTLKHTLGASITYSYRRSFYETHSFQLGYRTSSIADTVVVKGNESGVDYYKDGVERQQFVSASYLFNSDHRDVIQYPLKGYQYSALIHYAGVGSSTVSMFEISASQSRHWDLKNGYYLSNFLFGFLSTPTSQPYSLLGAMGYRRQLVRGYEVYVIEAPAFALTKTTLKKRIFYKAWRWEDMPMEQFRHFPLAIYLKTYFDLGYAQNYPLYRDLGINKSLSNTLLAGAGAGLDVVTLYDLVFRFEYTFPRQGQSGFFLNVRKEF